MTKESTNFIKRGIIFSSIILAIFLGLNSIIIYFIPNPRFNIIAQTNYNHNADILIIGNSHAEEGIDSRTLSKAVNLNVTNFSFSQQESAAVYYSLCKLFNKNQPKVVILEAYTLIQNVEGAYDYMPLSIEKVEYYKMLGKEATFSDVFLPIIRLHNCWTNPNLLETLKANFDITKKQLNSEHNLKIMSKTAIDRHKKYNSNETAKELKLYRFDNINKINKLCIENGAKLIITMLPWYKTLVSKINYKQRYYDPIKNFCLKNNIPYFDMNIDSNIAWDYYYFREQDYTQNNHLNSYGKYIASCEFSYYLDSIDENIKSECPQLTKLDDFLGVIDSNNDILLINKNPMPISPDVLQSSQDEFTRLGFYPSQETNKSTYIQYISGGVQYSEFDNYENLNFMDSAVNIYELDKNTKQVISHAVVRWDVFDTVFIINDN